MNPGGIHQPSFQHGGVHHTGFPDDGFNQPGGTTVVVVQQPGYGRWRNVGPMYLRQGVRVGGAVLGAHMVICLGIFGIFLTFAGIMFISIDHDPDFWEKFDRSHGPSLIVGCVLLVFGCLLLIGSIALGCFAKKKYEEMRQKQQNNPAQSNFIAQDNPGRVINPNAGNNLPGANAPPGMNVPGQMAPYPQNGAMYPQGVVMNPPIGGYPAGQMGSYPTQPGYIPGEVGNPSGKPSMPYPPPAGTGADSNVPVPTPSAYDAPPPYVPDIKPS